MGLQSAECSEQLGVGVSPRQVVLGICLPTSSCSHGSQRFPRSEAFTPNSESYVLPDRQVLPVACRDTIQNEAFNKQHAAHINAPTLSTTVTDPKALHATVQ